MDLRSKLLMAEVPTELEAEFGASSLLESFVQQLQVMSDTSAALQGLSSAGHPTYCQPTFTLKKAIAMDALPAMQGQLKVLELEADVWKKQVKASRNQHYFLNYFTMRDILRIRKLVEAPLDVPMKIPTTEASASSSLAGTKDSLAYNISVVSATGFHEDHAAAALRRCDNNLEAAVAFLFGHSQHMDRMVAEDAQKFGVAGDTKGIAQPKPQDTTTSQLRLSVELTAMLYAVSSTVNEAAVPTLADNLFIRLSKGEDFLNALGVELSLLFGKESVVRNIPPPGAAAARHAGSLILVTSFLVKP